MKIIHRLQSPVAKATFAALTFLAYVAAFFELYQQTRSPALASLSALPVVVVAWFWGARVGFLASLLTFPLNTILLNLVGQAPGGWDVIVRTGGGSGTIVLMLVGVIVGHLHDLHEQLKQELTARRQAEQALQEDEEYFRQLAEATFEGITIHDQGTILAANASMAKMFGYEPSQVIGMSALEFAAPESRELVRRNILAGYEKPYEATGLRKDGTTFAIEVMGRPITYRGQMVRVTALRDITERKQTEEALRASEAKFRTLVEQIPAITYTAALDAAKTRLYVSPQIETILGFTQAEWLADPDLWRRALHPDDRERILAEAILFYETGQPFISEYRCVTRDGRAVWFHDHAVVVRDSTVQPQFIQGTILDITARKQAEERLRRRTAELEALAHVSTTLRQAQTVEEMYAVLLDTTLQVMGAQAGTFFVLDEKAQELSIAATKGYPKDIAGLRLRSGQGLAGQCALTGQPILTDDIASDSRLVMPEIFARFHKAMCFPLHSIGGRMGVILICFEARSQPADSEVNLLTAIAEMTSNALYRAALHQQTERRAREFAALYETSREIAAQHDLPALLPTLVERARRLLHADGGAIYLLDRVRQELKLGVTEGFQSPSGMRLRLGEGVAGRVAQTHQSLVVDDYQAWPDRAPQYQGIPFRSVVGVPMLYGGELVGVLAVVQLGDQTRKFTQADAHLLSLFAAQAAGAVHNAGLLAETRQRVQELAMLYDAGLTLNRTLDPRTQLKFLLELAMTALRANHAEFLRYDAAQDELHFEFGLGYDEQALAALCELKLPLTGERGISNWVGANRLPLNLPDAPADPRWIVIAPAVRSALFVPVQNETELRGVLGVLSHQPYAFTAQDERLLVLFANQIAVAMNNALLFGELQHRLAELEAVNKVSTALRAARTLDEMLPILLVETLSVLNADAGMIWLYDPDTGLLDPAAAYGGYSQIAEAPMKPGEGLVGSVFASGQTRLVRDAVRATGPFPGGSARPQIPPGWDGACVPIRTLHEVAGVFLAAVQLPREVTIEEVNLLTTLTEIAGIAIHRMRLREQTEQHLQRLTALHAIDTAISASLDLRLTLNILLDEVTSKLGVDAADVTLLNPHTQLLEYAAGRGFRNPALQHTRQRLGEGNTGQAALERRTVFIPDLRLAGQAGPRTGLLTREEFTAYYAVPLVAKGQVKGVLEVFQRTPLKADQEWMDFLETLAGQAAIAIDNANLFESLQRTNAELALAYDTTLEGWARALELRDHETEGHTLRVVEMTLRLARAMGVSETDLVHIHRGALLHDIGKMGIPDSILLKPGPLTEDEWVIMRKHPQYAHDMLSPITFLRPALDIPYCHHEKWDGTGYPRQLKGEAIPLSARLFAVVDVWDALRSDRPYRKGWPEEKVRDYIREQAGKHFDPQVVAVFLQILESTAVK